jgi:hypothetical protein
MKKWKNIVNVYAALSAENIKELTYVKGKIPKGRIKYVTQAAFKFKLKT